MLRLTALLLLLCSTLANAAAPTVLQRPIELNTGNGVLYGSLLLPQQDTPPPVVRPSNTPERLSTSSGSWRWVV